MFNHCLSGFCGLGATNAPGGLGQDAYYKAGTPFLWFSPSTEFGFGLSFDPGEDARQALAVSLAAHGYRVTVVYEERGGALKVAGSQNIDRAQGRHIRDQITQAAEAAGFTLQAPVQFNVQAAGSSWQVGTSGQGPDNKPVPVKSIFGELGVDLSGDPSFVGGTVKNLILYGAIGLGIFALINSRGRR